MSSVKHRIKTRRLIDLVRSEQIEKVQYYYKQNGNLQNLFTACLLINNEGKLMARGLSIKSDLDQHNKTEARSRAFGRAVKALKRKENGLIINRLKLKPVFETSAHFQYKSMYLPEPTLDELQMFSCLRQST